MSSRMGQYDGWGLVEAADGSVVVVMATGLGVRVSETPSRISRSLALTVSHSPWQ